MIPNVRVWIVIAFAGVFPSLAEAQSSQSHLPRIGLLAWSPCNVTAYLKGNGEFGPFFRGLADYGYRVGESIIVECRGADAHYDNLVNSAKELVNLPVDIIVTTSQPAGQAAHEATREVPIVSVVSGDPIAVGLADSLSRPGGNLTGVSYYATELTAKRLELLKEAIPSLTKIGVINNPHVYYLPFEADAKRAAEKLGIVAKIYQVSERSELEPAISQMKEEGAQALFVLPDLMFASEAALIGDLAIKYRLPSMTWGSWFAELGCLMAYSSNYDAMNMRLAFYVDRLLKGAKPADLPIEQPTTFALLINLKTARAIGMEFPPSILLFADQVIE